MSTSEYMFDPALLGKLDFSACSCAKLNPPISPVSPGEKWLLVRPLQRGDYDKGFLQLLAQLTAVGDITRKQFNDCFTRMKKSRTYYTTVIEDTRSGRIVAAGMLSIEQKFIHHCALRARLDDLVVDEMFKEKQLGRLLTDTVISMAKHFGCYKISVNCKNADIGFYESTGYIREAHDAQSMTIRFKTPNKIDTGSHSKL